MPSNTPSPPSLIPPPLNTHPPTPPPQVLADTDPEGRKHCIRLLRSFEYRHHVCLVFEPMVRPGKAALRGVLATGLAWHRWPLAGSAPLPAGHPTPAQAPAPDPRHLTPTPPHSTPTPPHPTPTPQDMNLRELTNKYGRGVGLNITAVGVYAAQLLIALRHLKRCRVLHADIKPDNILVNARRSKVKVRRHGAGAGGGRMVAAGHAKVGRGRMAAGHVPREALACAAGACGEKAGSGRGDRRSPAAEGLGLSPATAGRAPLAAFIDASTPPPPPPAHPAPPRPAQICDFGSAMFAGENERTPYLVSRFYRAPEVVLGLAYGELQSGGAERGHGVFTTPTPAGLTALGPHTAQPGAPRASSLARPHAVPILRPSLRAASHPC
jgi:serine/threonine protein kinase